MHRRIVAGTATVALLAAAARPSNAQQARGDSLFVAGQFDSARVAYEAEVARNPEAFRALLRLGLMAGWRQQFDSALVLIRRVRRLDAADPDARLAEARVLAWAGRFDEAIVRADSVVARDPANAEAATFRSQVLAWRDEARRSVLGVRATLEADPRNLDQQQAAARGAGVSAAPTVGAAADDARRAARGRRAAGFEAFDLTVGWNGDSDRNRNWLQTATGIVEVAPGLRLIGTAGLQQSTDVVRAADRRSGELGVFYRRDRLILTGGAGARQLLPAGLGDRSLATWRGGVGYVLSRDVGVGAGVARYPFDETALLIGRALDITAAEANVELASGAWQATGVAGYSWFTDGNRRTTFTATLTRTLGDAFVGVLGRGQLFSRDTVGVGYFSPGWWGIAEVRAGYALRRGLWEGRVSGGLGVQQVRGGGTVQSQWHAEGRLGRRFGRAVSLEAFGGITNAAASSTTGAFRFGTMGTRLRLSP